MALRRTPTLRDSRPGTGVGSCWHGIQIRHLAALEAVATERSFNRAARKLGYTQSAISHQIAVLEGIVGERLLTRPQAGSPRVAPTAAGTVLLGEARRILARLQETHLELAGVRHGRNTAVRVGVERGLGSLLLPSVLDAFAARAPDLEVDLVERRHATELWELLDEEAVDLVVASVAPARAEDVEVLRREPIVAVFAASACLPAGPVSAERLARMPLAHLRQSKATEALLDAWRGEARALDVRLRSEDPLTVLRLIASGRAVGVMPELQLEGYTADVQTRALEPALARSSSSSPRTTANGDRSPTTSPPLAAACSLRPRSKPGPATARSAAA